MATPEPLKLEDIV